MFETLIVNDVICNCQLQIIHPWHNNTSSVPLMDMTAPNVVLNRDIDSIIYSIIKEEPFMCTPV